MAGRIKEADAAPVAKLFDRIGGYWDTRNASGVEGLALLNECIERTASKDRDWDALSRFVTAAGKNGQAGRVKKIIRAAFGDQIKYAPSKQHPSGGTFVMGWTGEFNLAGSNTYTVVRRAVEDKVNWDSNAFQKGLSEVLPEAIKPPVKVDDKAQAAAAKHLYEYIADKVKAGMDQATLMDAVAKMLKNNGPVVEAKQF